MRAPILAAPLALFLATGAADADPTLSAAEVDVIRARAKAQAAEAEAFAETIRRKAEAVRGEAEAAAAGARANRPRPGSVQPAAVGGVDFDRLIAQATQMSPTGGDVGPQLLAFVSFSMPDAALRRIVRDVTAAGGAVVFRGMPDNSAKAFSNRLRAVLGTQQAPTSIGIDPRLFRAFGVTQAPTFIVVSTGFELCDGFDCQDVPPPHDRMTGNVSVAHVLETVAGGRGSGAAVARVLKRRLEKAGGGQ